ncbi:MAG: hypothetical protein SFX73_03235 [Kofleriaceae bacterium]|nr:hypothetical protein [Kofleriaceae bacterium]
MPVRTEEQLESTVQRETTTVGIVGLLLPFFVVLGAALLLGVRAVDQLGWMLALLAVPIAILALRRAAAHTHGPTSHFRESTMRA